MAGHLFGQMRRPAAARSDGRPVTDSRRADVRGGGAGVRRGARVLRGGGRPEEGLGISWKSRCTVTMMHLLADA